MEETIIRLFKIKVQGLVKQMLGIALGYRIAFIKKGSKNAYKIINEINDLLNRLKKVPLNEFNTQALDILISIKGKLAVLDKKYGIDVRQAQTLVLSLEKDWETIRNLVPQYPNSDWLDDSIKKKKGFF